MKNIIKLVLVFTICCVAGRAAAETLYVTDRILLGLHQEAADASPVIASIPSGTAVTVLERGSDFIKVQLADGKQGWLNAGYLKPAKPATAQLDEANARYKQAQDKIDKAQDKIKSLQDEIKKHSRTSQALQDEISNDKSTIKELQKKLKEQAATPATDTSTKPSQQAEEQIKDLQAQVKKLNEEKLALVKQTKSDSLTSMHDLQSQNQQLQARIEAAQANLKGEQVPSASELASIRPSFPLWYWILLLAIFVIGVTAGFGWFDFHHRKRHGGFRI